MARCMRFEGQRWAVRYQADDPEVYDAPSTSSTIMKTVAKKTVRISSLRRNMPTER